MVIIPIKTLMHQRIKLVKVGADWCQDKIHTDLKSNKNTEPDLWIKEPRDLLKVLKIKIL